MTNSPNSGGDSPQTNRRLWLILFNRTSITLGLILVGAIAGGAWWLKTFLDEQLVPLLDKTLTDSLKRPVQVGRLERFSLTSLRFGPSALPSTTLDLNSAKTKAVEVEFDPTQVILNRHLELKLNFIDPTVYAEQYPDNTWFKSRSSGKNQVSGIKTEVSEIKFSNATVALLPRARTIVQNPPAQVQKLAHQNPIVFNQVTGQISHLEDKDQILEFAAKGKSLQSGTFNLTGESLRDPGQPLWPPKTIKLLALANNLKAEDISRLIPLPLELQAGRIDANLNVEISPIHPQELPNLMGTATFRDVTAQITPLPQKFTQANGGLRAKGKQITLENASAFYGKVFGLAQGTINIDDSFNLTAQVKSAPIPDLLDTLKVTLPVSVLGKVGASVKVIGKLAAPVVQGTLVNVSPLQVDKIDVANLKADFQLKGTSFSIINALVNPSAGGEITANGQIKLDQKPSLVADFIARNLPGESLALSYGIKSPVPLGKIQAKGTILGPADNVQTVVNFQANEALFPTTGELIVDKTVVRLRNAKINLGSGTTIAQGLLTPNQVQILASGDGINLATLKPIPGLSPLPLNQGIVSGRVNVSAPLVAPSLQNIQAIAEGTLALAGGKVNASGTIKQGIWQTFLTGDNLPLASFNLAAIAPNLPKINLINIPALLQQGQLLAFALNVSGTTASFQVPDLQVTGSVAANIAGANLALSQINLKNGLFRTEVNTAPIQLSQLLSDQTIPGIQPQIIAAIRQGSATANLNLSAQINKSFNVSQLGATGDLRVRVQNGLINVSAFSLQDNRIVAQVATNDLQTGQFFPEFAGNLNSNIKIGASLTALQPSAIQASGNLSFVPAIPTGTPTHLQLDSPNISTALNLFAGSTLTAQFQWNGERLDIQEATAPNLKVNGVVLAAFTGMVPTINNFDLNVKASNFNLQTIASLPVNIAGVPNIAGLVDYNGRVSGNLTSPAIDGNLDIYGLAVNNIVFDPVLSGQIAADLNRVNFQVTGRQDKIAINLDLSRGVNLQALNSFALQRGDAIASGKVQGNNLAVNIEQFPIQLANIVPPAIPGITPAQNGVNDIVAGNLTGNFDINLADLAIGGNANIANLQVGNAAIEQVQTAFNWNGQKLQVASFNANNITISQNQILPQVTANGFINANLGANYLPQIGEFDFNIQANHLNLKQVGDVGLHLAPPNPYLAANPLSGEADFQGHIGGTLTAPSIQGNLAFANLAINQIAFDPQLSGKINASSQGIDLQIAGKQDQLVANIDLSRGLNVAAINGFKIQHGDAIATGIVQGDYLQVSLNNFALATANIALPSPVGPGLLSGNLTGNVSIKRIQSFDLAQLGATGNIAIANFRAGRFIMDNLGAQFNIVNGIASLANAQIQQGESKYSLENFRLSLAGSNPQFQGTAKVEAGQIQTVLTALQWFDISDISRGLTPPVYSNAQQIPIVEESLENLPLLSQLRRFSEIETLIQERNLAEQNNLPPLADFKGTFGGTVNFTGSLNGGIAANFDLTGSKWNWGKLNAEKVIAKGSLDNGSLTLIPVRLEDGKTLISFSGKVGVGNQSGQLRVENFPIETLRQFVDFRFIDITGNVNVTAALAGNQDNPLARGVISFPEGRLNGKPLQKASGSFSYANARLNFGADLETGGKDPIEVNGSFPYRLSFMKVFPDSDKISLNVNVKNEGLSLLNLLNNEVSWLGGKGQVQLMVGGTVLRPTVTGGAVFEDAIVKASVLPDPITGIKGKVNFTRDRLNVELLKGQFSKGEVTVKGVLPLILDLTAQDPDYDNPLTVNLNRLAMNLRGLYQGDVNGKILLKGNALVPKLSGQIILSDGQVLLSDPKMTAFAVQSSDNNGPSIQPEFNNLKLILGDRVRITRAPILEFLAAGDLSINGPLTDLQPEGTIRLKSGQVNLFTTQFSLDKDHKQTAQFFPNIGLDPVLNVSLVATVQDSQGGSRLPNPASNEVQEDVIKASGTGSETVIITARVKGQASQLLDQLRLTSSPTRSPAEIVALIGGGFINTLGRGNSTLGIANLAGSAIFGNFQNLITNATGLSEFRLFPTLIPQNQARSSSNSSTLGLAAEAGLDLSRKLSTSVLKILTAPTPLQFNLRYRLTNKLRIRGGTDFSGDSQAVIEYETRF